MVLLALGWLALPLARLALPGLPCGGVVVARPLALLLVSYVAWILASARLIPFAPAILVAGLPALAVLTLGALLLARRGGHAGPRWRDMWAFWLAHELGFVAVFLGFAWLRGFAPDITFTEKPMELMVLNSVLRAEFMPPLDGWLAGFTVNYYYLGYVVAAVITLLADVPVGYAFNLMLTTVVALAASLAFGIGATLWALHRDEVRPRLDASAGLVGALAAYALVAAGNLVGGIRWLQNPAETVAQSWWGGIGWASSRVVVDTIAGGARPTINEFPWFSFLLGDLHPHVLALPFGLAALAVALDWWRLSPALDIAHRRWSGLARLALGALVVGALYAINSWDFPLYLLLTVVALLRPAWEGPVGRLRWRVAGATTVALVGLSVLLFLPFYLSFTSFAGSASVRLPEPFDNLPLFPALIRLVGVVHWDRTDLGEFFQVFGFLVVAAGAWLLCLSGRDWGPRANYITLGMIAMALAGTLVGSAPVAIAGALVVLALALWFGGGLPASARFTCFIVALGLALPVVAEFVYLRDVFGDRMNTVFKAYYQSWTLLSPIAALGVAATVSALRGALVQGLRSSRSLATLAGGLVVGFTLLLTLGYPTIATYWRAEEFRVRHGLDGLGYLAALPDERAALDCLATLPAGTVVAEDPGHSYGEHRGLPYARAATITGSIAPLGWPGHEQQWRGGRPALLAEINQRFSDMHELYGTTDRAVAQAVLDRYGIEYVYVGLLEREPDLRARARLPVYSAEALAKFDSFMEVAFQSGRVTIYRRVTAAASGG